MVYKIGDRKGSVGHLLTLSIASGCLLLAACDNSNPPDTVSNAELLALVTGSGLTGDPTTGRTLPAITDAKAALGKRLFFTKGLGGDDDSACVTCHHPMLGGGDDLSLPIGVGAITPDLLGPGRFHGVNAVGGEFDGGPTVPRNAPTTFNIALWDQALFHDGRVESLGKTPGVNGDDGLGIRTPDSAFGVADPNSGDNLTAAQSRFPVTSPEEMRGFSGLPIPDHNADDRLAIETKLAGDWDTEFTTAYGDPAITYTRIAESIGEYERSQVFVDTPWKAYVEGDNAAITESAKRGAVMFFSSIENGGANCVSCHAGDFFTDEQYHVLATPQIGRGKGDDNGTLLNDDFGRARETMDSADRYKFRTATLLNVEVTGPWGHAGGYTTLENMVSHMLNPVEAIANYDFSQLDANANVQFSNLLTNTQFALTQLEANRANDVTGVHRNVAYNEDDVTDLVAFLKTLTDPCVKDRACMSAWITDTNDADPDSLRVNAVDNNGVPF